MHAFNNGINMIDTALNYRGMRSERDIGICLTKVIVDDGGLRREEIVIATKAGILPGVNCPVKVRHQSNFYGVFLWQILIQKKN